MNERRDYIPLCTCVINSSLSFLSLISIVTRYLNPFIYVDKEHFATKEDPEVKCEPKDFDFIESDTAHLTSDTVIIKRKVV